MIPAGARLRTSGKAIKVELESTKGILKWRLHRHGNFPVDAHLAQKPLAKCTQPWDRSAESTDKQFIFTKGSPKKSRCWTRKVPQPRAGYGEWFELDVKGSYVSKYPRIVNFLSDCSFPDHNQHDR